MDSTVFEVFLLDMDMDACNCIIKFLGVYNEIRINRNFL